MTPRDTLLALAGALGLDAQRLLQTQACAFTLEGNIHIELQWREAEESLWLAARVGYALPSQRHALAVSALMSSTAQAQDTGASVAHAPDSGALYLCRPLAVRELEPARALEALQALAREGQAARRIWSDAQLLAN